MKKAMPMNFTDKKISVVRAIAIMAKSGIEVDDDEATVILDLLYLLAKNHKKDGEGKMLKPQGEIEF